MEPHLSIILKKQLKPPPDAILSKIMQGTSYYTIDCEEMVLSDKEIEYLSSQLRFFPEVVNLNLYSIIIINNR